MIWRKPISALVVVAGAYTLYLTFHQDPPESAPVYANCENPIEGKIQFDSKLIAHSEFSKHFQLAADASPAVLKHLRYLMGFYNSERRGGVRVFNDGNPKFQILSVKPASYGRDLNFDFVSDDRSRYPKSFLKERKVSAADEAVEISYSAEQRVIVCGASKAAPAVLPVALPLDPYLAFWSVRKESRLPIPFGKVDVVTNPCIRTQAAESAEPSMHWYLWNPTKPECDGLLKVGRDYQSFDAAFMPSKVNHVDLDFEHLKASDVLETRLIFGFVGSGDPKEIFDKAQSFLQANRDFMNIDEALISPGEGDVLQDASLYALLRVFRGLKEIATVDSSSFVVQAESFLFHIDGRLKQSGQRLLLQIYYGPTKSSASNSHWEFTRDALKNAQLVFYVGHSGMGRDMNLASLKSDLSISDESLSADLSQKPYQLLAIFGCYSMVYFGSDYLQMREGEGRVTDLALMGSGRYPYATPLKILGYLDSRLSDDSDSLAEALSAFLDPNEMILFRRQDSGSHGK